MASAFSHALAAAAMGSFYSAKQFGWRSWVLGMLCAILPDADVISFSLGIPYEHVLGHRGFTHSFLFALIWGWIVCELFFRKVPRGSKTWWMLCGYFFLCTASHAVLDALTNGGLGVAFFAPFDNSRYFFPWRPVQVSPIGVENFFSEWGWRVIKSELFYLALPSLVIGLMGWFWQKFK